MTNINAKQDRDLTAIADHAAYAIIQEKLRGATLRSGMTTTDYPRLEGYDNAFIIPFSFDEDGVPQVKDHLHQITIGDIKIWQGAYHILELQIDYTVNGRYEYDPDGRLVSGSRIEYEYDIERSEPEIIIDASRASAREIHRLSKLITFLKKGNVKYVLNRERHPEVFKRAVVTEYERGGVTQDVIASYYEIDPRTLRRWIDKYAEK